MPEQWNPPLSEVSPFTDHSDPFQWCMCCYRAFRSDEYRMLGGLVCCHYNDCAGNVLDFKDWSLVTGGEQGWPDTPEIGVVYDPYAATT